MSPTRLHLHGLSELLHAIDLREPSTPLDRLRPQDRDPFLERTCKIHTKLHLIDLARSFDPARTPASESVYYETEKVKCWLYDIETKWSMLGNKEREEELREMLYEAGRYEVQVDGLIEVLKRERRETMVREGRRANVV